MIMRFRRSLLSRGASSIALCGALLLVLSACGPGIQSDPVGQNSGSAQDAQGAFNLTDPNAIQSSVGQTVDVYDTFTSVTVAFSVSNATTTTTSANLNSNTQTLDPGEEFLELTISLQNTSSTGSNGCPNHGASGCIEYLSPLQNFRLIDSQGRPWPTTSGAMQTCTNDPHTACTSRAWLEMMGVSPTQGNSQTGIPTGGLVPGMTFSARLDFVVPTNGSPFTLYFAPYRYADSLMAAGGSPSGRNLPTLAEIAINV
jgi:hypothetical protein